MTESVDLSGQISWPRLITEGRSLSVTKAPATRVVPELSNEADILIVGFSEERRGYQQFRHQQVYAASSPLTKVLLGRGFRRAYFTDGAQRIRGFDQIVNELHGRVELGRGELVVHVSSYERLAEEDRELAADVEDCTNIELVRSLRQSRAFEA
ncbi:MAG: hypothetical protein ABIQ18_21620 [Umezawaea sp.]